MKLHLFSVGFALFTLLIIPTSAAEAYFSTAQTATDLGNGMTLFTVSYKFGFLNRDVYMPILATRNKDFADKGNNLGYSILFNGKTEATNKVSTMSDAEASIKLGYQVLPGKAKAIVLADAQIKDGRYYLPRGKSATFTLVAIVDVSKSAHKNDISLLVTSLPFTMIDSKETIPARLNPSELQYYVTPEIDVTAAK